MLEWVDLKKTPKRVKPFSVSSKKVYINNNYRTAHSVGHSKLTPLDIVDFYKRKQTNENMETEMKEMNDKPKKNALSEDDNLMKWSQSKLEKEVQQKNIKRIWTKILKLITKMITVNKNFKN